MSLWVRRRLQLLPAGPANAVTGLARKTPALQSATVSYWKRMVRVR